MFVYIGFNHTSNFLVSRFNMTLEQQGKHSHLFKIDRASVEQSGLQLHVSKFLFNNTYANSKRIKIKCARFVLDNKSDFLIKPRMK